MPANKTPGLWGAGLEGKEETMGEEMIREQSTTTITFDQTAFASVDEALAKLREEAYEAIHGQTESRAKSLHRILGLTFDLEAALHQGEITHE